MKIGILGGGAWGTALAQVMAAGGHEVRLWAHEPEVVEAINRDHENPIFLPGVALAPEIIATGDVTWVAETDLNLIVTPAQHMRAVLRDLSAHSQPLLLCSKGIEAGSHKLLSEVAAEEHPDSPIGVLSGPTFAGEVARGLPTAVTVALADPDMAEHMAAALALPTFRPYASTDVIGAEIGGAVKNVLAIACGVVEGAGLGQNARAALIARGFAEMTRFGLARGARIETLTGLSGLGDLVLTCSSTSSRNFSLGKGLGEGQPAATLLADRRTVAEGAFTAPVLREAARAAGVDMPVVEAVCALLNEEAGVSEVITALLARPIRSE
ncbi:MAG TPA: NAD(P)H-dependent glycerol-3-phosphate dehydrogenase [Sphingobium sp.]|uniref:NAD(P)H-dependent glycerol-3-phosphate dehydrogenase n=1 Tax=Sphingobium sp. TaxID=1912891 RepID=UPI002ED5642C